MIQSYVFRETSVSGFPENFHAKKQYRLEVYKLANIKSAKKRILVIETKTLRNKMHKKSRRTNPPAGLFIFVKGISIDGLKLFS